ncbi:HlyD family efflux transporter periplasmic adaptor subunit [Stenotrophomonas sp.]|uniref:HlyD family efflux transporter periplasmic adaptor subunit n=1 Tax=Stenotrophomonas sp. TaxID=69392 RepID=UPI0028A668E1|nr:HlyD family efflux transporter periplasmic adaptor subunit [Stenotrophomonas sp.]
MSSHLFRDEVLQRPHAHWLGAVVVMQRVRLFPVVIGTAGFALLVLGLALGLSYTQRHSVEGRLVPMQGMATVLAPTTGLVRWIGATEGQKVVAGDTLLLIERPSVTGNGEDVNAVLLQDVTVREQSALAEQAAAGAQARERMEAAVAQLKSARVELSELHAERETRAQQVQLANATLARLRQFEQERYVSAWQLTQQQAQALDYLAQLQAVGRRIVLAQRAVTQLEREVQVLADGQRAVGAGYAGQRALLQQQRVQLEMRAGAAIKAPVDGVVGTQLVKSGQSVRQGQTLMSVLPGDGRLQAELLVPGAAVAFMAPGDKVQLRYAAFPFEKFGHQSGVVASVGTAALGSSELFDLLGEPKQGGPFYRVTVELGGQSWVADGVSAILKPGMRLEADLLGERRSVLQWLLEPLLRLWGRLHGA